MLVLGPGSGVVDYRAITGWWRRPWPGKMLVTSCFEIRDRDLQKPLRTYAYFCQPNCMAIIIVSNCMQLLLLLWWWWWFIWFLLNFHSQGCLYMWLVDVDASCFWLWGKNAKILEIGFNAGHSVCLMLCLGWSTEWFMDDQPSRPRFWVFDAERKSIYMENVGSMLCLPA